MKWRGKQREEMERVREELCLEEQAEAMRKKEIVSHYFNVHPIIVYNTIVLDTLFMKLSLCPYISHYIGIWTKCLAIILRLFPVLF